MELAGTLRFSCRTKDKMGNRIYYVRFLPAGRDEPASLGYRCMGDFALLRAVEYLIPGADVRLRVLKISTMRDRLR